jgi:peptidoglycan/LPS O-acetylase OafA/YrhL
VVGRATYYIDGNIPGAVVLSFLMLARTGVRIENRFLMHLGAISYSLYLVHEPVMTIMHPFIHYSDVLDWKNTLSGLAIILSASFLVASVFYTYLEQPLLRRLRGLLKAPQWIGGLIDEWRLRRLPRNP